MRKPSRVQLAALLVRIERAKEFDRSLDRDLGIALDGWEAADNGLITDHAGDTYVDRPGGMYPSPTESLDEAIALVERLIPGAGWRIERPSIHAGRPAFALVWSPKKHAKVPKAEGATPALAVLAALVRTLIYGPRPKTLAIPHPGAPDGE